MHLRSLGATITSGMMMAVLLAGCSQEAGPRVPSEPVGSKDTPTEASPGQGSTPGEDATASEGNDGSSPTGVTPASGEEVVLDGLSFRLPETSLAPDDTVFGISARDGVDSFRSVAAAAAPALGGTPSLNTARDIYLESGGFVRTPRQLKPVRVDGLRMFHVAGMVDSVAWLEAYGAATGDRVITMSFEFRGETTPAKERRRVVDSVLATVDFTD